MNKKLNQEKLIEDRKLFLQMQIDYHKKRLNIVEQLYMKEFGQLPKSSD